MNGKPYFLNLSLMSEQADRAVLESAVMHHLTPLVRALGEDAAVMRLDRIQGAPLPEGHPCTLVLQMRFATASEREDYRDGPLDKALASFHADMPHNKCMVLETMLDRLEDV